jgi:hypothetical protein
MLSRTFQGAAVCLAVQWLATLGAHASPLAAHRAAYAITLIDSA